MNAELARSLDEDPLYKEMKCSPGGVMLLVRLRADLAGKPPAFLREMRTADLLPDPGALLGAETRLSTTYSWLEKQFGRHNAARALVEVSAEILSR
ncbi:MAG: hypothetical protein ACRDI1_00080 [Actinomycetota bacterium]